MKTLEELERERENAGEKQEKSYIGAAGAVIIVLGAAAIWFFVTAKPDAAPGADNAATPTTAATNVVSAATSLPSIREPAECERLIGLYRRDGIVKGPRRGGRVAVDEQRWHGAEDYVRRSLIAYVSCAAYGGRDPDDLPAGAGVIVQSATSGTELAKADRSGMIFAAGK